MKMTWTAGSILALGGIIAAIIVLIWLYGKRDKLKEGLDITSPKNLAYRAVTQGVTAATGREETLGGWLAEIFSGSTREANRQLQNWRVLNPLPRGIGYDSSGGPAYG